METQSQSLSLRISCNKDGSGSTQVVSRLESTQVQSRGEDEYHKHEEY